jgi:hypothetical protein
MVEFVPKTSLIFPKHLSADLCCTWCGADRKGVPCEDVNCYTGCLAVLNEDGKWEYVDRETYVGKCVLEIRESTAEVRMPDVLITLVVEYAHSPGRFNPAFIHDHDYMSFMHGALDQCGVVETELNEQKRFEDPRRADAKSLVSTHVFQSESSEESWFAKMCQIHKDELDKNYACVTDAISPAMEVWKHGVDEDGETLKDMVSRCCDRLDKQEWDRGC